LLATKQEQDGRVGLRVGAMVVAVGVGRGTGRARYAELGCPCLAVSRTSVKSEPSQRNMTTYCTVPWRWHSDTAVMLVGLGSATAVTTCGARWRSVRGAGEPASLTEAASRPYRAEARRAEGSRTIMCAIQGKERAWQLEGRTVGDRRYS
jgi:hypothetical protein